MVNKIKKLKKLKKIRIHREGTETLLLGGVILIVVASLLWMLFECKVAFWSFLVIHGIAYGIIINFLRSPPCVYYRERRGGCLAPLPMARLW